MLMNGLKVERSETVEEWCDKSKVEWAGGEGDDIKSCISNGYCGSKKLQESVSTMNMVYAMAGLSAVFCLFSFIQHRRYERQMQAQVKGIIAEYMPLDQEQMQNTAVSDEDDVEFT